MARSGRGGGPPRHGGGRGGGGVGSGRSSPAWGWEMPRERAAEYLRGQQDLGRLIEAAMGKAEERGLSELRTVVTDFDILVRLVRAYWRGEYREVATEKLVLAVAGLLYFVSPYDLLPDFLGSLGLRDDVVVLGFVLRFLADEVAAFKEWERRDGRAPAR